MKGLLLTPFLIISVLHVCSCIPDVQVENDCSVAPRPGGGSVEVKFPFRLNDQPASCGFQGFELYNHGDSTMLKLPFDQPLAVDYISYSTQMLYVSDPDGCLFRRLLYLNLSASPFTLGDDEIGYYYNPINCSSEEWPYDFTQVSCLSDLPGHYYFADSSFPTQSLSSCETLTKDQFQLSDDRQRLFLAWDEPDCRYCNGDCRLNRKSNKTQCVPYQTYYDDPYIYDKGSHARDVTIGLCAAGSVAIATITILLVYRSISKMKKKKQNLAVELFLKEYKSMKPTRYSYPELKKMTDDFKTILGQGGYGSVFQGKLHNGVPVAVKVLDNPTVSGDEFTNEIAAIGTNTAADEGENAAQIYFPEWIYNQLKQGEELRLVTGSVEDAEIAKKLTMVALWCVQWRPVDRPSMKVAVQMLEGSLEMLPLPPNPFAPHVGKK
ncbi:hypothetical protein OPV22_015314 [Ensete ventricosum]|uniref:Wall-associated receptor kinase galacturonan-binding domain-containing protein n=1 Tax=Ensete ventricosum TaxID=4639 RepID=A0AAV8R589_ENSVE|nr:hypothetical protein OPV22_015314 [Ensete ventricosum]